MRAIEQPTIHEKMWGLWVTAETISKNMGSLGDSITENRGCLWSFTSASPPQWECPRERFTVLNYDGTDHNIKLVYVVYKSNRVIEINTILRNHVYGELP